MFHGIEGLFLIFLIWVDMYGHHSRTVKLVLIMWVSWHEVTKLGRTYPANGAVTDAYLVKIQDGTCKQVPCKSRCANYGGSRKICMGTSTAGTWPPYETNDRHSASSAQAAEVTSSACMLQAHSDLGAPTYTRQECGERSPCETLRILEGSHGN